MVVSLLKLTYNELVDQLEDDDRIIVWTCNDCVRYCGFGGREAMDALADRLEGDGYHVLRRELVGISCNRGLVRSRMTHPTLKDAFKEATVIIPLVCSEGYETVHYVFKNVRVIEMTETFGLGVYSEETGMRLNWPLAETGLFASVEGISLGDLATERGLHTGPMVEPRKP